MRKATKDNTVGKAGLHVIASLAKAAKEGRLLKRTSKRSNRRLISQGHASYNARQREWLAQNPGASQREIEQAMNRIARECGV